MFCLTFLCTEKGPKNDLKQPILQLSNIIKTIVEQTIVEHPHSRRYDTTTINTHTIITTANGLVKRLEPEVSPNCQAPWQQ
jgi:hypothetical protein